MKLKQILTTLGLAVLLGVGSVQAADLRVGVEGAYPPFSWKESDGTLKGFDIEIAEALCKEMGRTCKLIEQDWDGMIPALMAKKYDAIVCLGAVIRGATPHFEYVSAEVSKGIAQVGLDTEVPIIFGIITSDTIEQAIERAGTKAGNKGWNAAMSAVEMVNLIEVIDQA